VPAAVLAFATSALFARGTWVAHFGAEEVRLKEATTKMVRELIHDETGASMAEYAMLLALIAVATIGAVQALRNQIISVFNTSASTIGSAQ
jgi:Flp pilus assembly pilin Flp